MVVIEDEMVPVAGSWNAALVREVFTSPWCRIASGPVAGGLWMLIQYSTVKSASAAPYVSAADEVTAAMVLPLNERAVPFLPITQRASVEPSSLLTELSLMTPPLPSSKRYQATRPKGLGSQTSPMPSSSVSC
ncbi:MAG: hypothetical protein QM820_28095 [Minicystis sp.]